MMREHHRDIEARSIEEFRSLRAAADWVERKVA
jgi:hypothetical protein